MDAWRLTHYRRPRLAEDVTIYARDLTVQLERGGHRKVIAVDEPEAANEIVLALDDLRHSTHPRWREILSCVPDTPWYLLVQKLDEWSLIEDSDDKAPMAILQNLVAAIDRCVMEAVDHVRIRVPAGLQATLMCEAQRWLHAIQSDGQLAIKAWDDVNFYRAIARLSIARLRTSHPPAFEAVTTMLAELAGQTALVGAKTELHGSACYAENQLRSHLSALADFFVQSLGPDAARRCMPESANKHAVSGSTFARLAEQAMRKHRSICGSSRFARSLQQLTRPDHPLAVGCHVETFHVTRRFVEIITPLMHCDLEPNLRMLIFQYFSEEFGHESFERATCESFGIQAEILESSCPLPLHVAFVDVFTMLAVLHPIAFLAAVPITEGILGEKSPVNTRFDELMPAGAEVHAIYHRHEQLNIDLNHASIARLALNIIPAVEIEMQQRALDGLALIFELNFRAWERLDDFYSPQQTLRLPQAFDPALVVRFSAQ